MGLLLILPLLVSGYLVCLKHPGHYCRLHRFEGQLLYLQVARLGWTCLVLSFVLTTLILCLSKQPLQLAGQTIPIDYSAYLGKLLIELDIATERNHGLWVFLLQVGLTAMIIPYCWARLFVRWRRRRLQLASEEELNQQLMLELLTGRPLRTLLRESIARGSQCMFTLNDRNVYVGVVSSICEPNESEGIDHAFSLIPTCSGYRDKDTLEIILDTEYPDASDAISIMLLQEAVVSATRFDPATWMSFQSRTRAKPQPTRSYRRPSARKKKTPGACA
ncbi:hypothetical protein AU074_07955 [Pseudomonas sp. ATCC PTA-122608]|jgi:hypothetical protein|uniref:hypothetical protein n=1 Tax=unclassified Pseudomonas TaxID=196821 RepID=UPI00096BA2D8|nr:MULTISPECIES: hypothetical protein [unclassified Pseudomonas]NIL20554.1 hypothetical protein [Pseudomonas sp. AN3A02]OLY73701.1 hypothetical protein AU074_07955 [Pseudomonas sp. ATCC PTA-122608]